MLLTGETIGADEAHQSKIVHKVVADARLDETALALARKIAASAPLATRAVLRSIGSGMYSGPLVAMEKLAEEAKMIFVTEDASEGARAMLERRQPEFKGA